MAYAARDAQIAPPAEPTKSVDWQTLCDMVDGTQDVQVAYAFGGTAPTTIKLGNGELLGLSPTTGYRRMFVEWYPLGWLASNPNYTGGG